MRLILPSLSIILAVISVETVCSSRISKNSLGNRPTSTLLDAIPQDSDFENRQLVLQVRGGKDALPASKPENLKTGVTVGVTASLLWLLWTFRESWMGLFDKDKIQAKTLEILHELNAFPKYRSYSLYTIGMAIWETFGLSTIPLETAAGMVFGWHGFMLSAVGKLLGAVLAFSLARYGILAEWVHQKLSSNSFLQLARESAGSNPLLVLCLLKCSCFPETIKNYGAAILHPIQLWMFVFGTIGHGWTFTALWTYLGVDTAMRLEDPSMPANTLLQTLLSLALINGLVVSPLAMAYWVRNMKETAKKGK
jgi:uncharacterized membrane protein YdjX (TVP38/TMEM64 family)